MSQTVSDAEEKHDVHEELPLDARKHPMYNNRHEHHIDHQSETELYVKGKVCMLVEVTIEWFKPDVSLVLDAKCALCGLWLDLNTTKNHRVMILIVSPISIMVDFILIQPTPFKANLSHEGSLSSKSSSVTCTISGCLSVT